MSRQIWLMQAGLLTAIPFVPLVGPTLGYLAGAWLDQRWSAQPWGTALGIVLGLAASGRATAQIIRQARDLQRDDHD
jgi:F0F1-type ATP synthase assembly protein I